MHVNEAEILLYIENRLLPEERKKLEVHVGGCEDCASQFAAFTRLPDILRKSIHIDVNPETFKRAAAIVTPRKYTTTWDFARFVSPLRASLAMLLVMCVVGTFYFLSFPKEVSQFRSSEKPMTTFILSPPDGVELNEQTPTFHWTPIAATSVYNFSLMDERGVAMWIWDVRDTMVILPASVVLLPGKTYLWRVESFLADKTHERSALHVFTYVPSK